VLWKKRDIFKSGVAILPFDIGIAGVYTNKLTFKAPSFEIFKDLIAHTTSLL
jgi:hypothetical protein